MKNNNMVQVVIGTDHKIYFNSIQIYFSQLSILTIRKKQNLRTYLILN